MTKRLLERQISLLDHLTNVATIFGDKVDTPWLHQGIDGGLLHLEARFCYEKRMGKIVAIFPRTLEILDEDRDAIFRQFVEMYPPEHIGRIENARQFRDFLCDPRRHAPHEPPYVRDVAACELACAEIRSDVRLVERDLAGNTPAHRGIRRSAGIILLHCAYDVRCIFEGNSFKGDLAIVPPQRATPLIVARSTDTGQPQIFEVIPPVFDLVAALDHWTDPAVLCLTPEADELIADLGRRGLIEARR